MSKHYGKRVSQTDFKLCRSEDSSLVWRWKMHKAQWSLTIPDF